MRSRLLKIVYTAIDVQYADWRKNICIYLRQVPRSIHYPMDARESRKVHNLRPYRYVTEQKRPQIQTQIQRVRFARRFSTSLNRLCISHACVEQCAKQSSVMQGSGSGLGRFLLPIGLPCIRCWSTNCVFPLSEDNIIGNTLCFHSVDEFIIIDDILLQPFLECRNRG